MKKNCLKCNKEFKPLNSQIKKGYGKYCSISCAISSRKHSVATKLKMSLAQRGEKCYLWKGGITPENQRLRRSLEYKLWRESVFIRDNYTCIWCGARNGKGKTVVLNADHIKPWAYFPELRFSIDNGRTLCVPCHRKTGTWGRMGVKKFPEARGQQISRL